MADLEFKVFKVPSSVGDWLAAFDGDELIFLGSYATGKKLVEEELADLFHKFYNFHVGKFTTTKWTKGNFWTKNHKLKLMGTDFQMKVWLQLLKIPEGSTMTYSDLAKKMKIPSSTRAVASAVAKNPICYWIPCHRVVGKGTATMKYHYGPKVKKAILTLEEAFA